MNYYPSNNRNLYSGSQSCCCLQITNPKQAQQLNTLNVIEGTAQPCEMLTITIDCNPAICTTADSCGLFRVNNPYSLSSGSHSISITSCSNNSCRICRQFSILKAPTIETPVCGSTINNPTPLISGQGTPGNQVKVCLGIYGCQTATVDANGKYQVSFNTPLPAGQYTITATQIYPGGKESETISCTFTVNPASILIQPIEARMGATFRTIDIDVLISGGSGLATVYYLLLPPDSPSPTQSEIINYSNSTNLLNGTVATGQFEVYLNPEQTIYTWPLTGLDKPNAPAGTTGVIDGYRYDTYIYVVFAAKNSEVLAFRQTAMGMPFASGLGTTKNPFTIKNLTPDQLSKYPDLLATNPLNEPGVDENARMLENIERLITLFEQTDGLYGLKDSMELNYLMTSDINLINYTAAYNGAGWQPIGDVDGWISEHKETWHIFSGVFDGGKHTISNLSMTPVANSDNFVGHCGLFGAVEEGTIKNLSLTDVTIDALATAPGYAMFGSFIAISRKPILSNLTLQNANIKADIQGDDDDNTLNIGGFVAEIFEGGSITNINGSFITIYSPLKSAFALGGFAAITNKLDSTETYTNINLSNVTISGAGSIGGLAGYMISGVNLVDDVNLNQINITAPYGESGGLIGRLYIYNTGGNCNIKNATLKNIYISTENSDLSNSNGGLIGLLNKSTSAATSSTISKIFKVRYIPAPKLSTYPEVELSMCKVTGGQINCNSNGGGLIGYASIGQIDDTFQATIKLSQTNITVFATDENAGGLIGNAENLILKQSFAKGVQYGNDNVGGLIGYSSQNSISDCYSTNIRNGGLISGGNLGFCNNSVITKSYSIDNVNATNTAGGIAGVSNNSTISNNFILGGTITAPTAHRILGADLSGTYLANNYALSTVIPPGVSGSSGLDGQTITSNQIISSMATAGWDTTTTWDTTTIASIGRPTLFQNPE